MHYIFNIFDKIFYNSVESIALSQNLERFVLSVRRCDNGERLSTVISTLKSIGFGVVVAGNRKCHVEDETDTSEKQRSMNGGEACTISRQARTTNYSGSISASFCTLATHRRCIYTHVHTDISRNIQFRDGTPAIEDVTQFNDDVKRLRIEIQEGHETP